MAFAIDNLHGYIHIPKTGGTSVTHSLRSAGHSIRVLKCLSIIEPRHNPITTVIENLQGRVFTHLNEPSKWYASYWKYCCTRLRKRNIRPEIRYKPTMKLLSLLDISNFNQSVLNILNTYPGFLGWLYTNWTEGCHFVGTTQNLELDTNRFLVKVGLKPIQVIHTNISKHPDEIEPIYEDSVLGRLKRVELEAYRLWERAYYAH